MHNQGGEVRVKLQHPLADTYLDLMRDWRLWANSLDAALRKIVETVSVALGVQRVGLWSYGEERRTLTLMVMFDALNGSFSHGAELHRDSYPVYFEHLEAGRVIDAHDVATDPRTREFAKLYAKPNNVGAMLDATVRMAGTTWGVLCAEHSGGARLWSEAEQWFAVSVADLVAQLVAYGEIRRGERWLRFVAENLPVGLMKTDIEGNCLYINPRWSQLAGADLDSARGEGWLRAVHPDDRAELLDTVRNVAQSGVRGNSECRLLNGGRTIWVACCWVSELNVEGFPSGVLGTFTDIMQERALRENERRYRALFDNSGDAIFLMEGDRFIDCNTETLEMFGCVREQIVGQPPYRFSPEFQPDGRSSKDKALEKIEGAFRGERQVFEWRHSRYDGAPFEAEVTLTCVTLDGRPHLLAAVRNIGDRKRAEQALAQSNERLHRINSIAARLYGMRDVAAVAAESVSILAEHGSTPLVSFFLYDAATGKANLIAQRDGLGQILGPSGEGTTWTLRGGYETEVDVVPDISVIPMSAELQEALAVRGTQSMVYIWLSGEAGRIGMITLEYRALMALEIAQREDLVAIGKAVSMALANVLFIARMEHQATHDTLTGLPNRALLQRELAALDTGRSIGGLLLLDLDRFKEINDTLGHHLGDKLLVELGRRLTATLEDGTTLLCRLGGDEFAILVREQDQAGLLKTAGELLTALRQPFRIDELLLEIGGSIGISLYPAHGGSGHELLRYADVAMYEAKRSGIGIALYNRELDKNTPERLSLMQELRAGIRAGELVLHYQPKVDLASGRVTGFEALTRWQHPQRGLLPPSEFLPFAEMSDAIHALTIDVLDRALAQQRAWRARGMHYSMAVNLSARNLINDDCFAQLKQLLRKHEADPSLLELEITETTLMQDPDGAAHLLRHLSELGIKFSIDDFGTGYSSLAYLHRLPIHALKIDRTFVMDMAANGQDAVIVKSTIALAHNLKLQVVAEGVEDVTALTMLREMGCDLAQGYFISRPQSAAAIEQWLEKNNPFVSR